MSESAEYYVVDFRPEWRGNPCVTVWRPKNAGYAYPLSWAGRYTASNLQEDYHERREGRRFVRFAVPCAVADALAVAAPRGLIDGKDEPVIMNTAANRAALRRARSLLTRIKGGTDA